MRNVKWAIFDLDDTLCHFSRGFFNWMISIHPNLKDVVKYEYKDYNLLGPFKTYIFRDDDSNYWLKRFEESGKMNDYLHQTDLLPYFKSLVNRPEYEVLIITARGWMEQPQFITAEWLRRNQADGQNVHVMVVPLGQDKADTFARSGIFQPGDQVIAVFDDVESHLMGFKRVFPFAARVAPLRPWNAKAPLGKWENIQRREDFGDNNVNN